MLWLSHFVVCRALCVVIVFVGLPYTHTHTHTRAPGTTNCTKGILASQQRAQANKKHTATHHIRRTHGKVSGRLTIYVHKRKLLSFFPLSIELLVAIVFCHVHIDVALGHSAVAAVRLMFMACTYFSALKFAVRVTSVRSAVLFRLFHAGNIILPSIFHAALSIFHPQSASDHDAPESSPILAAVHSD